MRGSHIRSRDPHKRSHKPSSSPTSAAADEDFPFGVIGFFEEKALQALQPTLDFNDPSI